MRIRAGVARDGKAGYLSPLQVEQLEATSRLLKEPLNWKFEDQTIQLDVDVPPYSVTAVTLEFSAESSQSRSLPDESLGYG